MSGGPALRACGLAAGPFAHPAAHVGATTYAAPMNLPSIDLAPALASAAFIVSVVSAIAAALAARSSGQSADAARRSAAASETVAEIEATRLFLEREPRWEPRIERLDRKKRSGGHQLLVELESIEPVSRVAVRTLRADRLWFLEGQEGVDQMGDLATSVRETQSGQAASWSVGVPHPAPGGKTQIEIVSTIGDKTWHRTVEVKLPDPPPSVVFA